MLSALQWERESSTQANRVELLNNKRITISIRAIGGVQSKYKDESSKTRLTKLRMVQYFASNSLVIAMNADEVIAEIDRHIEVHAEIGQSWSVGLRDRCRTHPYDEQQCDFPSSAWISRDADSLEEALSVVDHFVRVRGFNQIFPLRSQNARQVFACLKQT